MRRVPRLDLGVLLHFGQHGLDLCGRGVRGVDGETEGTGVCVCVSITHKEEGRRKRK